MKLEANRISAEEYRNLLKKKDKKSVKPRRITTNALEIVEGEKMPFKVSVNPLSVNDAWKGERFRSDDYKAYRTFLLSVLPKKIDLPKPPYELRLTFGLSNSQSDWDNPIKPTQDLLQEMYGFNDKLIKRGIVEVEETKKNEEFIMFEILSYKKVTN